MVKTVTIKQIDNGFIVSLHSYDPNGLGVSGLGGNTNKEVFAGDLEDAGDIICEFYADTF